MGKNTIRLTMAQALVKYLCNQYILIDDKKSNINEWAAKGGIAIRCKNGDVNHVIKKLKELGYE